MTPLRQRIAAGLGANAFGQAANVGIQLASLPLFLSHWDAATYGTWLILTALPSYLYMADVGMVAAAANRMTMAMGAHDTRQATRVFHSAIAFMAIVCSAIAAIALPLIFWLPAEALAGGDRRQALALMTLSVLLHMLAGLSDALFKATGRYANGMALFTLSALAAWVGSMLGLAFWGTFSGVALGGLLAQALAFVIIVVLASRGGHGIVWGLRQADRQTVASLVKPGLSFMAITLANGLNFQGLTLVVGYMFGPVAVAIFNTSRTLARISVQVASQFSFAVWPEFSRLYGQGGIAAVAPLYRRAARLGGGAALAVSVVGWAAAPWLLELWTHGRIPFHAGLMAALMAYAAVGGLGHVPRVLLMSTNQHVDLAAWTLGAAALGVALGFALGRAFDLTGVGVAMLVSEAVTTLLCLALARRLLAGGAAESTGVAPPAALDLEPGR